MAEEVLLRTLDTDSPCCSSPNTKTKPLCVFVEERCAQSNPHLLMRFQGSVDVAGGVDANFRCSWSTMQLRAANGNVLVGPCGQLRATWRLQKSQHVSRLSSSCLFLCGLISPGLRHSSGAVRDLLCSLPFAHNVAKANI